MKDYLCRFGMEVAPVELLVQLVEDYLTLHQK